MAVAGAIRAPPISSQRSLLGAKPKTAHWGHHRLSLRAFSLIRRGLSLLRGQARSVGHSPLPMPRRDLGRLMSQFPHLIGGLTQAGSVPAPRIPQWNQALAAGGSNLLNNPPCTGTCPSPSHLPSPLLVSSGIISLMNCLHRNPCLRACSRET